MEDLHESMSSLQSALKDNSDLVHTLKIENETLKSDLSRNEQMLKTATLEKDNKIVSIETEGTDKEQTIISLKKQLDEWKQKYDSKENETNKRLKLLAEDLYIQYSSKHEQKVKLLKKGYESKYQGEISRLETQHMGLTQEVEQLTKQLEAEREEKRNLLNMLENKN